MNWRWAMSATTTSRRAGSGLKGVAIDDGDDSVGIGAIAPTALNVRRGVYRPLSRPLFIYVNLASLARPDVEKFLTRYLRQADL